MCRLKIEVVTLETAVRFLFGLKNGEGQPPDIAERVAAAHAELRAAVEAKATEGKKPAKGAPVLEEGVIDEAVFTLSFCQTLPVELLRRCVSAQVKLHRGCRRRGFVLDLWDGKTVLDADSLQEAINSILPPTADSCSSGLVDLVAELHVSFDISLCRFQLKHRR